MNTNKDDIKRCTCVYGSTGAILTLPSGIAVVYNKGLGFSSADRTVLYHCKMRKAFTGHSVLYSKLIVWAMFLSAFGEYYLGISDAILRRDPDIITFLNSVAELNGKSDIKFSFNDLDIGTVRYDKELTPDSYDIFLNVNVDGITYANVGVNRNEIVVLTNPRRRSNNIYTMPVPLSEFTGKLDKESYGLLVWLAFWKTGLVLCNDVIADKSLKELQYSHNGREVTSWGSCSYVFYWYTLK